MSSVSYCFNICRSVDKKITAERRASISHPTPTPTIENISPNTGTLIFGRRFSFGHVTLPTNLPTNPEPMDQ